MSAKRTLGLDWLTQPWQYMVRSLKSFIVASFFQGTAAILGREDRFYAAESISNW